MSTLAVESRPEALGEPRALQTAIYVGAVRHRRFDATAHAFSVRLYFVYLDLAELDRAFAGRWLWSHRRLAPMRFRRRDYFGPPDVPLVDAVKDAVARRIGVRPDGAVRLLTNLRSWGYLFNPVSFYYCFDRSGRLAAVLAEITNTPWGERHHYVLPARPDGVVEGSFDKAFHVSPFQPMEQRYRWRLTAPGDRLFVHMENQAADRTVFDASLTAARRPWTGRTLAGILLRHPWMTGKVVLSIYWQALRLWWKRATFHPHPAKGPDR